MRYVYVAALLLTASGLSVPALADSEHSCQGNADCNTYNIQEGDTFNRGGNAHAGAAAGAVAGAVAGAAAGVVNVNTVAPVVAPVIAPVNAPVIAPVIAPQIKPEIDVKPTISPTISPTNTNTANPVNTVSPIQTVSPTISPTQTVSPTISPIQTVSPTITVSPTNTQTNNNNDTNTNNAEQNVTFEAQKRAPVNTAYAAPLAVGEDTCMGSSSIGGQGVGFGLSIGTSWTDENCQRLKNSRQLQALGYHRAAVALMCLDDSVAIAMDAAGTPCRAKQAAVLQDQTVALDTRNLSPEGVHTAQAEQPRPYVVAMAPVPDVPSKKLRLRAHRR